MAFDVSGPRRPRSGISEGGSDSHDNTVSVSDISSVSASTKQKSNLKQEQDQDLKEEGFSSVVTSPDPGAGGILLSPEQLKRVQPERKKSQRVRRAWLSVGGVVVFGVIVFASIRAMMQTTTTIDLLRSTEPDASDASNAFTLDAFQQGLNDFSDLTNPENQVDTIVTNTDEDLDRLYDAANPESDSDHDGLTVEREREYRTNPTDPDTDGDGYLDGEEVKAGFSPTEAAPISTQRVFYRDVDRSLEFTYPSATTLSTPVLISGPIAAGDPSIPHIKVFELRSLFDGVEGVGQLPPETWQQARQRVAEASIGARIDDAAIPAVPVYGSTLLGDATDVQWLGVVAVETHRGTRGADGWVHFTDRDGSVVLARVTTFFASSEHVIQFVSFYDTDTPTQLLAAFSGVMPSLNQFDIVQSDMAQGDSVLPLDAFQERTLNEHERIVMSVLIDG